MIVLPELNATEARADATDACRDWQVDCLRSFDELVGISAEWNRLSGGIPFRTADWALAWWRHYQPAASQLFVLTVRDHAGRLVGLAPWCQTYSPAQGCVLQFLGSGEVCSEYLSLLCQPAQACDVARAIVDWLTQEAPFEWDLIQLDAVDPADAGVVALSEEFKDREHPVAQRPDVRCWRSPLPRTWDDLLAGLTSKRRHRLRAELRNKLDSGLVTLHQATDAASLERGFAVFVELHQKRRTMLNEAGCFASASFARMHREVAERFLAQGRLRLLWLEHEGRPLAVDYGFVGCDTVYHYQSGFEPELANLGPGTLMLAASQRLAIAEGRTCFDFLRGDEPYKAQWQAAPLATVSLRIASRRPIARLRQIILQTGLDVKGWARSQVARRAPAEPENVPQPRPKKVDRRKRRRELEPVNLWVLGAYYYSTWPLRSWVNSRRAAAGQAPIMVLFYHRIADANRTPWTMSNAGFARQIAWLRRHFDLVSLSEAQRRIASGANHRASVTITFDDGYAENCDHALPLLIRERIPCTYFVSSQHILQGQPFSHDVARGRPLPPNTPDEIRRLADVGIEIGCHTRSHANLGRLDDPVRLYEEVVAARDDLADLIGQPITHFAFPYGQRSNLSREAFELARRTGYAGVCSAYGGFNFPGHDSFHVQRIHADEGLLRLKNWLTLDPRKIRDSSLGIAQARELFCPLEGAAT